MLEDMRNILGLAGGMPDGARGLARMVSPT